MISEKKGAIKKLESLVKEVSQIEIEEYPEINITISIGSCQFSTAFKDMTSMIKRADIALYKAKKTGKNRLWCD